MADQNGNVVQQMMSDPDFGKMPLSEQRKALAAADSSFGQLSDDDFGKFVAAAKPQQQSPQPLSAGAPQQHPIDNTSFVGGMETGAGLPGPLSDFAEGAKQLITHPIDSLNAIGEGNFRKNFPGGEVSEKEALGAVKQGKSPIPPNPGPDFYHYTPSPIVEAIKDKRYTNAAGQVVGGVGAGLGLGRLAVGPAEPQPLARENATHVISSAVNPDTAEAPGFRQNVAQQLDTIVNHGREIGADAQLRNARTPGEALDTFAKTAESAAQNDPYYVNYLKPNLDAVTDATQVPGWAQRTGSNHATIGELSAR